MRKEANCYPIAAQSLEPNQAVPGTSYLTRLIHLRRTREMIMVMSARSHKAHRSIWGASVLISRSARSGPASGPESNEAVILSGATSGVWGTRTEAVQNVPQANPERVEPSTRPAASRSETSAPGPSSLAVKVGDPRYAVTISRPSPV